jgi:excinuclease UvrABC nuclease subunit
MLDQEVNCRLDYLRTRLNQLLESDVMNFSDSNIEEKSGVYAIYENDAVIYVGKSGNLRNRLRKNHLSGNVNGSHFRKMIKFKRFNPSCRETDITQYIRKLKFKILCEKNPMLLEHYAIAALDPELNRGLKKSLTP